MLFDLFIVFGAHCIGDYPLQGPYLAKGKRRNGYLLLCHCTIYTLCIVVAYAAIAFKNGNFYTVEYGTASLLVFIYQTVFSALACEVRDAYDSLCWPPCTSNYEKRSEKNKFLYLEQGIRMFFNYALLSILVW